MAIACHPFKRRKSDSIRAVKVAVSLEIIQGKAAQFIKRHGEIFHEQLHRRLVQRGANTHHRHDLSAAVIVTTKKPASVLTILRRQFNIGFTGIAEQLTGIGIDGGISELMQAAILGDARM